MLDYLKKLSHYHKRAMIIKKTLGYRTAAGYLRNKGVSLSTALYWIAGRRT